MSAYSKVHRFADESGVSKVWTHFRNVCLVPAKSWASHQKPFENTDEINSPPREF